MDLEWFADDGPIDAKPIASIEPKYDFEVKPIAESKYDFEVKPIRSLDPKCDFEVNPINSVGPKCDFEAEPIELVGPKCDFEAKPVKSLDLKCHFARENEENKILWTSNVLKTYKGAGLLNLGNTCFLNAVLQCFVHTVPLFNLLLHNAHVVPCDLIAGFYLICIFKELIGLSLVYEAYEGRSISPWILVKNLSYFTSGFYKYEQEDAHEFLLCFLNRIESRFSDIVQQVFCIHLVSKLRCCNCGHYSNIYEPLIDVSLEIKDVDILHSVLESFTRVEKLDDPEIKFSCERCKVQVSIEKQLMLYNVPFVAIFHLKRLQNDGSVVRKVEKHVSFPLELDLLLYTDNNQTNNFILLHCKCIMWALSPNILFHSQIIMLPMSVNPMLLQSTHLRPLQDQYFHELMKIVDNELKKTVQTSTPGPPSAINSSKENNASQDVGVIKRMAPLLPKSPSKSQSTLDQISSKNQWLMDPEQEMKIMQPCSMIKKRVLGPRGEELIAALCILGSRGSSLNAKR
ncbi:hypothetical protein P3S68_033965 [Capsicum galapagoense]